MDNKQLRTRLLYIYGAATAFNLIDEKDSTPEALKAVKDTGLLIRDELLKLINQIPKE